MNRKTFLTVFALALIPLLATGRVSAQPQRDAITTPQQLINAVNDLRASRGLSTLAEHSALMQSAQSQANYMAASGIVTHARPGTTYTQQLLALGFPLAGDLSLGGFRSENILSTGSPLVWNGVPPAWQDEQHMNTMLSANYTHIGAGIAQNGGTYYYAVDAAAAMGSGQMQDQAAAILTSVPAGSNVTGASQYVVPMTVNTALPDGDVYHVLEYGQTLWDVAIQYDTKVKEIQALNNLGESTVVQQGQKLLVKRGATQPAPTPQTSTLEITPSPMIVTATPYVISSPTASISLSSSTATSAPIPESSGAGSSSSMLVAALIFAALIGGGVAVWLIRDPN